VFAGFGCVMYSIWVGQMKTLPNLVLWGRGELKEGKGPRKWKTHRKKPHLLAGWRFQEMLSPAQNAMDPINIRCNSLPIRDIPTKHCLTLCKSERLRPFLCFCKLQRLHAQLYVHKYLLTCIDRKKEEFRKKKKRSTLHIIFTILDKLFVVQKKCLCDPTIHKVMLCMHEISEWA